MFPVTTPWKIGTFAFGALSLVLGFQCVVLNGQVKSLDQLLTNTREALVTARNNATVLEAAVADQNADVQRLHDESQRRLDAANAALVAAQQRTKVAERRAAGLTGPIAGSTLEERVRAVDARVLESLE